jgi:hypothetical protein
VLAGEACGTRDLPIERFGVFVARVTYVYHGVLIRWIHPVSICGGICHTWDYVSGVYPESGVVNYDHCVLSFSV